MPAKAKTRQVKQASPQEKPLVRDYTALMQQLKKLSPDWSVNNISMESDILANQLDLLNYSRDLWKTNPYLQAYADEMAVNVHGPQGIRLRMKIQEESDRVVHVEEEKQKIRGHWQRRDRVNKHLVKKGERPIFVRGYEEKRGAATIKAGAPDIYANSYIGSAKRTAQSRGDYPTTKAVCCGCVRAPVTEITSSVSCAIRNTNTESRFSTSTRNGAIGA